MVEYDVEGPNTRTRRYWVASTIGITAMVVFAILSLLLLGGMMFGSESIKPLADKLFPWSLLALAVAGVAMLIANRRAPNDSDEEEPQS